MLEPRVCTEVPAVTILFRARTPVREIIVVVAARCELVGCGGAFFGKIAELLGVEVGVVIQGGGGGGAVFVHNDLTITRHCV